MANNKSPQKVPFSGGILQSTADYFKLVLRLMSDPRVSSWIKLLPIGAVIYMINPFDIPGPLDDAGIFGLTVYMFVELCPPDVVEEHRQTIRRSVNATWSQGESRSVDEDVVDGEFREEK